MRNLFDGQVEIVAEGAEDVLQNLIDWSHKGPLMAKVEKVVIEDIENNEQFNSFEVH